MPYWVGEVRAILAGEGTRPVPFGRTKTDPERVAAVERDRHADPRELMARIAGHVAELRQLARALGDDDWGIVATHPTLGEMAMSEIFDEFLVGHLEQHADQLEELRVGD